MNKILMFFCVFALIIMPASAVSCDSGYYHDNGQCIKCPGVYLYSAPDAQDINECYMIISAGKYIPEAENTEFPCPLDYYCPGGVRVYYDAHREPGVEYAQYLYADRYIPVEYIENVDEKQCIDTEIKTSDSVGIACEFWLTDPDDKKDSVIMGSRASSNSNTRLYINTDKKDNGSLWLSWNTTLSVLRPMLNEVWYNASINLYNSRQRIVNGTKYSAISEPLSPENTANIGVFCALRNSGTEHTSTPLARVRSAQVTDGPNLVRNLMPAFDSVTRKYGMFDTVSGIFFGNRSTGDFIGPPITGAISCGAATNGVAPRSPIGGADVSDCGRTMNFGDYILYLRSVRRTRPALVVQFGNHLFYGDATTEQRGHLRVKSGDVIYSIFNPNMD